MRRVQQSASVERFIADQFGRQAQARLAGEQNVLRIAALRVPATRATTAGRWPRSRSARMHRFHAPASRMNSAASQSSSSGCEGWSPCVPKSSEVRTSTAAEQLLPDAIDGDARGQRIIARDTSQSSQGQGVGLRAPRQRRQARRAFRAALHHRGSRSRRGHGRRLAEKCRARASLVGASAERGGRMSAATAFSFSRSSSNCGSSYFSLPTTVAVPRRGKIDAGVRAAPFGFAYRPVSRTLRSSRRFRENSPRRDPNRRHICRESASRSWITFGAHAACRSHLVLLRATLPGFAVIARWLARYGPISPGSGASISTSSRN